MSRVFFWKPTQGDVSTCLTQWYIAPFEVDGKEYACAEQYMMYQKAALFGDYEIAGQIMQTTDPHQMKKLGKEAKGFIDNVWKQHRVSIVFKGNMAKFTNPRNAKLKEFLLSTGDAELIEASPLDCIWGIGLDEADALKRDPSTWPGENLLGQILMNVRKALE